jgi:hypothetical protein
MDALSVRVALNLGKKLMICAGAGSLTEPQSLHRIGVVLILPVSEPAKRIPGGLVNSKRPARIKGFAQPLDSVRRNIKRASIGNGITFLDASIAINVHHLRILLAHGTSSIHPIRASCQRRGWIRPGGSPSRPVDGDRQSADAISLLGDGQAGIR